MSLWTIDIESSLRNAKRSFPLRGQREHVGCPMLVASVAWRGGYVADYAFVLCLACGCGLLESLPTKRQKQTILPISCEMKFCWTTVERPILALRCEDYSFRFGKLHAVEVRRSSIMVVGSEM
jgi:hypothetical protein